ncbi:MAG: hypothetical protein TR69_WS6001000542 [candidate division WS6 bacterium OLB20]|uniref:HAD family hydrolase n=1 Tax=candidate division WS6 bacterium OLB20 TaxID=1617426 RepID=A0A136LY65_9BACT|nr:MAG: hypothetical protein TR69_WS6001000542 [candidate division WS6 bacterium OLB20]
MRKSHNKYYKAVLFDWDGTAVADRYADSTEVADALIPLLEQGVFLAVISGTSYENIGPSLVEKIPPALRSNLYFGLARGAYTFTFDSTGERVTLAELVPDKDELVQLHTGVFNFHLWLLEKYGYETDIVFTRPNYCKIDMLPGLHRGDRMFISSGEMQMLNDSLHEHGVHETVPELFERLRNEIRTAGMDSTVRISTDAKYFEAGLGSKTDNTRIIWERLAQAGVKSHEVAVFGDEFSQLAEGITGSDGFIMIPELSGADFYDVSEAPQLLPEGVTHLGGGPESFIRFLHGQNHSSAL